jgi:hypothetical protein
MIAMTCDMSAEETGRDLAGSDAAVRCRRAAGQEGLNPLPYGGGASSADWQCPTWQTAKRNSAATPPIPLLVATTRRNSRTHMSLNFSNDRKPALQHAFH